MPRAPLVLLLLAAGLAGCGDNLVNSRLFYVGPTYNKPEDMSCEELQARILGKDSEIRAIEAQIAKAKQDPGGGLISLMAHEPRLAPARAERYALREAAAKNDCRF